MRASTTNPRVITSGVSSSVPDCRPIATTGTTSPSPDEVAAVAQHFVADLAAARAVDQHAPGRDLVRDPPARRRRTG